MVFLDTMGLVALVHRGDSWHRLAVTLYDRLAGVRKVTTDAIVVEIGSVLRDVRWRHLALALKDRLDAGAAIKAAQPGDRILIRPGLYKEGIVIEKSLEIIGDGEPGDVVIEAVGKDALLFKAMMGRITNLTLRQVGGGNWYGVDIAQGRLELEGCDITSKSLACVAIHDGADPRLRRNRIHDSKSSGVLVWEKGQGMLEDNDIFGNARAGVEIKTGSNPTLRHNRIKGNGYAAFMVYNGGAGVVEDNDLRDNDKEAWLITDDCKDKVHRTRNQE